MPKLVLFPPDALLRPGQGGLPDFGPFRYRFLAQGDSWFSIGALPPSATTNLLMALNPQAKSCAVNCAHPGFTLRRMVDSLQDPNFKALLTGRQAWPWDGLLMSAGGNDLIEAIQVLPKYGKGDPNEGQAVPPQLRLLLRPDEWKPVPGADQYLSDTGWTTFSNHLASQFAGLQALRDGPGSKSPGVPVFVHCYEHLVPRPAPVAPRIGPWLAPALRAYGIPPADGMALGTVLIDRLKNLLDSIGMPNLHVVDTRNTLVAAVPGSSGPSGDWQNEIHPTKGGYDKLAAPYAAEVNVLFP